MSEIPNNLRDVCKEMQNILESIETCRELQLELVSSYIYLSGVEVYRIQIKTRKYIPM